MVLQSIPGVVKKPGEPFILIFCYLVLTSNVFTLSFNTKGLYCYLPRSTHIYLVFYFVHIFNACLENSQTGY